MRPCLEAFLATDSRFEVDAATFAVAYAAFAAKRLQLAETKNEKERWGDELVEAAIATRDLIAPIPEEPGAPAEDAPVEGEEMSASYDPNEPFQDDDEFPEPDEDDDMEPPIMQRLREAWARS